MRNIFTARHPYFNADNAHIGFRLGNAVIHVIFEGMQRHSSFAIPFSAGDFNAVQSSGAHNLNAFHAQSHGARHGAAHGAAKHNSPFQLRGDIQRNQFRVGIRLRHFLDIHKNVFHFADLAQLNAQLVDAFAFFAYQNPRSPRMNDDMHMTGSPFYLHQTNIRLRVCFLDMTPHFGVFNDDSGEIAPFGVPARAPVTAYRQTKTNRINFTPHNQPPLV